MSIGPTGLGWCHHGISYQNICPACGPSVANSTHHADDATLAHIASLESQLLAAQAALNVKHEALAYSVGLFKMVVRHLPGQQITWIKSGDEPDINAALAFQPDLSALSAHDAGIRKEAAREALEKAATVATGMTAYTQFQTREHYRIASAIEKEIERMIAELDQPKEG